MNTSRAVSRPRCGASALLRGTPTVTSAARRYGPGSAKQDVVLHRVRGTEAAR